MPRNSKISESDPSFRVKAAQTDFFTPSESLRIEEEFPPTGLIGQESSAISGFQKIEIDKH